MKRGSGTEFRLVILSATLFPSISAAYFMIISCKNLAFLLTELPCLSRFFMWSSTESSSFETATASSPEKVACEWFSLIVLKVWWLVTLPPNLLPRLLCE
jgi:hypothetical protein